MVEFFLKEDLVESTILNTDTTINIESNTLKQRFLDETNEWYVEQAEELGVDEDEIKIYNPAIDTSDDRNKKMVKLCTYHYLKNIFFSLMKKPDDIYDRKLSITEKEFNKMLGLMTPDRIMGIKPAEYKTADAFMTITKRRGEGGSSNSGRNSISW